MKPETIIYYLIFLVLYNCTPTSPNAGVAGTSRTSQGNIHECTPDEECSFWWEKGEEDFCICQESSRENCNWDCYTMACDDLTGIDKEECERRKKEEFENLLSRPVVMKGPIPTGHEIRWRIKDMISGNSKIYTRTDNIFIQSNRKYQVQIIPYKRFGNKLVRLSPQKTTQFLQNSSFKIPNQANIRVEKLNRATFNVQTTAAFKGKLKVNARSSALSGNLKIYNTGNIPNELRGKRGMLAPEFKTKSLILPNQGQISSQQLNKLKVGTLRRN